MDALEGLLGDNADEKLNGILGIINSDKPAKGGDPPSVSLNGAAPDAAAQISPEFLLQAQQIMSRISASGGDDRSALLKSLKPFMRESRRETIDDAIKLMNLARMTKLFENLG